MTTHLEKALFGTALVATSVLAVLTGTRATEAEQQHPIVKEWTTPEPVLNIDFTPAAQVERFVVLPTATPKPVFKECEDLPSYRLDNEAVESLCRLLWSSPLRSESEKVKLLWCVFNRVSDQTGRFADTITECITKTEFTFFDRKARISDRNRELVEREMTRWMAYKDGYGIGWHPSTKGVFVRFVGNNNLHVELLDDPYGEAL